MDTDLPTLIHLSYSPWSERARWALDARGVAYRSQAYQPVIGELGLRRMLGKWRGPVSVPVLLTRDGSIADSWDIARWADARGDGPRLFPKDRLEEVVRWNTRAEEAMGAGRALSLTRVLGSPEAISELTPPAARRLGPVAYAITRAGVARTRRKYGGAAHTDRTHLARLVSVLEELRAVVGSSPQSTLLGAFSYADVSAAQVLAFVRPADARFFRMGNANRKLYGDEELADRYSDVVAWRDALYERYRAKP